MNAFRSVWGGLLIVALATLLKGISYLPFLTEGHVIPAVERWVPTTAAAVLWTVAGAAGLVAVVVKRFGAPMVGVCGGR